METLYTYSYLAMLASTLLWFYLNEKEIPTRHVKIIFFSSLAVYIICMIFGDANLFKKLAIILPRDLGILIGAALVANNLAKRPKIFVLVAGGMAAAVYFFYFDVLYATHADRRIPADPAGELLVDIKNGQIDRAMKAVAEYNVKFGKAFPDLLNDEYSELDDYYLADIPGEYADNMEEILELLMASGAVDHVEMNEIISLNPPETNADPASSGKNKYGLNDPDIGKQWAFEKMKMDEFYKYLNKKGVKPQKTAVVAILDTGVDGTHEDLNANFFTTKEKYNKDVVGHGTHCAGIAAAVTNNNIGIASVAPGNKFVKVTSIKVLNDRGSGTQQSVISGMIEAADKGADVISMSLGGPSNDRSQKAYEEVVKYAAKSGAIVVAAAGNNNGNAKAHLPGGAKGVICVSAVNVELKKAPFSNYVNDVAMGIAAPGVQIYSTLPGNKYMNFNGTSMATPHVAGLLGVMKSLKPKLTTEDAFEIMKSTGVETGDTKKTGMFIQPAKVLPVASKQ